VIPVAGFEGIRASAFIISPHQQYMKKLMIRDRRTVCTGVRGQS
jgi:hypothetical protein